MSGRIRIATTDDLRVGLVRAGTFYDVSDALGAGNLLHACCVNSCLESLMVRLQEPRGLDGLLAEASEFNLTDIRLGPPVPAPPNIFGAPVNYQRHLGELDATGRLRGASSGNTVEKLGFFLKSTSAVVGPHAAIQLPDLPDREFHYEGEVAVVIGSEARGVPVERAWSHVLGITGALDITMRLHGNHAEERSLRKSFVSFAPLGPSITYGFSEAELNEVGLRTYLNDELVQESKLEQLIVDIPELVSRYSAVSGLAAGDVIATGTPSGVGPIEIGDTIRVEVDHVGAMELSVEARPW